MTKLHDTHGHLDLLLQFEKIIPRISRNGELEEVQNLDFGLIKSKVNEWVLDHELFIHATVSGENYELCKKLFVDNEKVKLLFGLHPEVVHTETDVEQVIHTQSELLNKYLDDEQLVGIGEIGLDYYHTKDKVVHEKQRELFRSQIELAIENNLTIQIHSRDAWPDVYKILKEYPDIHGKFLVHCYSEGPEELAQILDLGGFVTFGGICTYKSAKNVRESFLQCPLDRLMLETDLPFLSPPPHRGKTCLPNYIDMTASHLAELRDISKNELIDQSRENIKTFYGI